MVNVFGESIGEDRGMGNPRVLRKVIAISGKYGDYVKVMMVTVWAVPCMEIGDPQEQRV